MPRIVEAQGLKADYIMLGDFAEATPLGVVPMTDPRSEYYERPMGFYSERQRSYFPQSSVRFGGVGGGGLTLSVMLAKEGVCDQSVADIDVVTESNVGRIPLLTPEHIGRRKVDVAAELITTHNPYARVRVYGDGVQKHNVDEFLGYDAGNEGPTIGFDEIELTEPQIALMFHRAARRHNRYVIAATDVERGGMVTTFAPNARPRRTFEHYMGAKPTDTPEEYLKKVRGFQLPTIPNIPTTGSIDTLKAALGDAPLPTTLRSVLVATELAMGEFENILTLGDEHYPRPHIYPRIKCANSSRGEDFVSRHPRLRSSSRVLAAVVRDTLGLNPPVSYSDEARRQRQEYRAAVAAGSDIPTLPE